MKKYIWLILIVLLAFVVRVFLFSKILGTSGGDSFEFLLIARRIIEFKDPFIGVKRLPFFPITLIPSFFLNIDGIWWGRLINSIFAMFAVYFLYLINLKLNINKYLNYLILILFTFSQVYLFYSLRPLSSSLFVTLFLASIFFAININKNKRFIFLTFISLGLLSMTRHEGFLVSLVVFIYFLFTTKLKTILKHFVFPGFVYLLIVSPFFISNYINHSNFLYLGYLDDGGGLYQPKNINDFLSNSKIMLNSIYSIWGNINIYKNHLLELRILFVSTELFIILGFYKFLTKINKEKILILILLSTQLLISLWLQPSGRYIQHLIPFLSIFLILGVSTISKILLPIIFCLLLLCTSFTTVLAKINEFNFDTKKQTEFTNEVKYLKYNTFGKVAIEPDKDYTRSYIALYYLGEERVRFIGGDFLGRNRIEKDPSKQLKWLISEDIKYVLDYAYENDFTFITDKQTRNQIKLIKPNIYEITKK